VSALVHSSTLVTAGVYLLIRFNLGLRQSGYCGLILATGTITILIAGIRAIFEIDIKKIVALSTLRQLGLIIRALGIGRPDIAFFHLLTHAYFKALLFICAGNIIHCANDYQDLRQIGRTSSYLPVTTRFITLRNIRLCGLPFLAGFYSKDLFLEIRLLTNTSLISVILFFVATALTIAYSLRFTLLTAIRGTHSSSLL
jgi:NADH-ubiquinone oxidoreductase chain 5